MKRPRSIHDESNQTVEPGGHPSPEKRKRSTKLDETDTSLVGTKYGRLGRLPAEIRRMIYEECMAMRTALPMRLNSTIRNEFPYQQPSDFGLIFRIDPACGSTSVDTLNDRIEPWGDNFQIDLSTFHPDRHVLDSMPIDKFRYIRIVIFPPNPKDPGQLLRAWWQVTRLLDLLLPSSRDFHRVPGDIADVICPTGRETTKLPPVEVGFVETETRTWATNGHLNESIGGFDSSQIVFFPEANGPLSDEYTPDLDILMRAFLRIRQAQGLQFFKPMSYTKRDFPVERLVAVAYDHAIYPDVFGTMRGMRADDMWRRGFDGPFGDEEFAATVEDTYHVWFLSLVDFLPGPTIRQLRTEIRRHWCRQCQQHLSHHLYGRNNVSRYAGAANSVLEDVRFKDLEDHLKTLYLGSKCSVKIWVPSREWGRPAISDFDFCNVCRKFSRTVDEEVLPLPPNQISLLGTIGYWMI